MKRSLSLCLLFNIFFNATVIAQIKENMPAHFYYEDEKVDDPYIKIPLEDRILSASYTFNNASVTTVQVNVDDAGFNIVGDAANEPSIAIDYNDPSKMAIGWRQFETITSNFRQAGLAITLDEGITWLNQEPLEADLFRSDPVLDTDSDGNFYYNSLNADYECAVFKSVDLLDWSEKVDAIGGDKQWMVVDKTEHASNGNIYAFWKAQFSACTEGSFTRSVDGGLSYETCSVVTDNPTRGTLALDAQGDLYACGGWYSTFKVLKSSTAKDPSSAVNWEINTTVDLKGAQALYAGPNPSGMLGQVWIATDQSNEVTAGNVYLLSAVERYDNGDPADIMFARSLDGANSWWDAVKINDDSSINNWQWFGTMSVAPNGRIDVTWLDTRDNPGTFLSALYYSFSIDGGISWSTNERISEFFDPHVGWPNQEKMGDYMHMISFDEGAHLAWAATFNGEEDIYYSFIPPPIESHVVEISSALININIAPNPVIDYAAISFAIDQSQLLQIELYDLLGEKIEVLDQGFYKEGSHSLNWSPKNKLSAGIYVLNIVGESGSIGAKRLVINGG